MTAKHPFEKRKQQVNETLRTNEYYIPMNITFESLADYMQCRRGYDIGAPVAATTSYFKLCFGNALPPPIPAKCLCGHRIIEQCYICPKNDPTPEQVLVVGNECIEKFGAMNGRLCEICGLKHRNRSFNVCFFT